MSQGLEAFRKIMDIVVFPDFITQEEKQQTYNNMDIIEKQLVAFEIIKNKSVDMSTFGAFEIYKDYEHFYNMKFHIEDEMNKLDEEEFELLKEVLEE